MRIKYYQINGKIKKSSEALISVDDYGLMRGYGIFETIRFDKNKLINLYKYLRIYEKFYGIKSKIKKN